MGAPENQSIGHGVVGEGDLAAEWGMNNWRGTLWITCISSVVWAVGCKSTLEEPTDFHDHGGGTGTPHEHEGTGTPHEHEGTGTPHEHEGTGTPHHNHPTDTPTETEPPPTPVASPTTMPTPDPNDLDGDGVDNAEDCAPNDPNTYPGLQEVCDHNDDDCDNKVDEDPNVFWYPDSDRDFYRANSGEVEACHPPDDTWLGVKKPIDCDDTDNAIHPGAAELCDNRDHDCNGDPLPCASEGTFSNVNLRALFVPELEEGCTLGETPDVLEVTCPAGASAVFRLDLANLAYTSLVASIESTTDGWANGLPGMGMELGSGPGLYGPEQGYGFVLGAPVVEAACVGGGDECPAITFDGEVLVAAAGDGVEGPQPTLMIDLNPEELQFLTGDGVSLTWSSDIIWAGDFGLRCAEAHCVFSAITLEMQ